MHIFRQDSPDFEHTIEALEVKIISLTSVFDQFFKYILYFSQLFIFQLDKHV